MISLSCDDLTNIRLYALATEFLVNEGVEPPAKRKNAKKWEPVFMPKTFIENCKDFDIKKFKMDAEKMKQYGVLISKLRECIRNNALSLCQSNKDDLNETELQTSRLAQKM